MSRSKVLAKLGKVWQITGCFWKHQFGKCFFRPQFGTKLKGLSWGLSGSCVIDRAEVVRRLGPAMWISDIHDIPWPDALGLLGMSAMMPFELQTARGIWYNSMHQDGFLSSLFLICFWRSFDVGLFVCIDCLLAMKRIGAGKKHILSIISEAELNLAKEY